MKLNFSSKFFSDQIFFDLFKKKKSKTSNGSSNLVTNIASTILSKFFFKLGQKFDGSIF